MFCSSFITTLDFERGVSLFLRIVFGVFGSSFLTFDLLDFFFFSVVFSSFSFFSSITDFSSAAMINEDLSRGLAPVV